MGLFLFSQDPSSSGIRREVRSGTVRKGIVRFDVEQISKFLFRIDTMDPFVTEIIGHKTSNKHRWLSSWGFLDAMYDIVPVLFHVVRTFPKACSFRKNSESRCELCKDTKSTLHIHPPRLIVLFLLYSVTCHS